VRELIADTEQGDPGELRDGGGFPHADAAETEAGEGFRVERGLDQGLGEGGSERMGAGEEDGTGGRGLRKSEANTALEVALFETFAQPA
jgi:hypothetical protein